MYISKIYLLFTAEILLILLAICISLIIYIIKRPSVSSSEQAQDETPTGTITSYSQYLEQEILRNEARAEQQSRIEKEDTTENPDASSANGKKQSQLLKLREMFLKTERSSSEHSDNENTFWESLLTGLNEIHRQFKTIETRVEIETEETFVTNESRSEKVFYIETQGKKVDGEINRLKDIIFDQDNTLNSLKHALDQAGEHLGGDSKQIAKMKGDIDKFQQQINDSKMCMEVLELENERLQAEIDQLEHQLESSSASDTESEPVSENIVQLKETLSDQEQQIDSLNETLEELQLEAGQSQKLKDTIESFARGSKEMMDCITILEEENENLHQEIEQLRNSSNESDDSTEQLHQKIKSLEEDIIKKDVAYAQLQDEFSSMEKEYISMYEKVHGESKD